MMVLLIRRPALAPAFSVAYRPETGLFQIITKMKRIGSEHFVGNLYIKCQICKCTKCTKEDIYNPHEADELIGLMIMPSTKCP